MKADTTVPPGYVKLLTSGGIYHMESVETGTVNFPYGEPHLAPTIILRNHDLDIIRLQGYYNDTTNQISHLTTMVSRNKSAVDTVDTVTASEFASSDMEEHEIVFDEAIIHKITENRDFIASTVSHIMQNTNLSDLVSEVDSLKNENKDIRSLLKSQQEMMNGMNTLLFTLLNKMHGYEDVAGVSESCDAAVDEIGSASLVEGCEAEVQTNQTNQYAEPEVPLDASFES